MSNYIVKEGESIFDVAMNSTGSLINLDAILAANNYSSWTPLLNAGDSVYIPDGLNVDNNTLRALQTYPASNNVSDRILAKVQEMFDIINNNWILATGFWNDNALWIDSKYWID